VKLFIYQDDEEKEIELEPPYSELYETKSVLFKIVSETPLVEPCLAIGDMKLELIGEVNDTGSFCYQTKLGKPLINHVGVALVELIDESDTTFKTLGTINVLSSKVTTERLKSMLEYICETDVALLHCCFSKTFLDSSGGKFEYTDLNHKLISTEKTINYLWDNRYKFNNQPCKRIKTKEVIKKYSPKDLVDDKTYSWLLSHMDELEHTSTANGVLMNRYGKNLTARHISTSQVTDDRDIFENQVIYTFLISVKKFIDSVDNEKNYKSSNNNKNNEFVDLVPFIQGFVSEKFNIRSNLIARINLLVDGCIKFITSNFTQTFIPNIRPRITQYVSRHNHYMTLYRLMDDWWNINASSVTEFESVHELLFSVKSMDKLYEVFVLLKLLEGFKVFGFKTLQSDFFDYQTFPSLNVSQSIDKEPFDVFNFYKLENSEFEIKLYLEPIIYPYRNGLLEGELYIIDKSPDSREAKKLFRAKHVRTPDYIISIQNKNSGECKVYILDAKYSKFDTVLYERLPTKNIGHNKKKQTGLVDKYLHGIRIYDKKQPKLVDGIFATYISGRPDKPRKNIHGISHDFRLFGDVPTSPFIDLIEFAPSKTIEESQSFEFIRNIVNFSHEN
jgi:hypothetical protein